jgi:hypothetical protein
MKKNLLFSFFLALIVSFTLLNAQDAKDFTIYNYDTQQEWTLFDYIGDYVIALVSGSFC